MPPKPELPQPESIDPARLQAVADWIKANVRPVAHALSEGASSEDQLQLPQFDERDYQLEAWVKLEGRRAEGGTRALGNLATGMGKTFVAAIDAARYKEWCAAQSPPMYPRFLYVSPQNDINVQAEKTFRSVLPDADYATFDSRRKEAPDADVTFATIQGIYQNLDLFDPECYEYIFYDETHHLEAETFKKVRDHFKPLFEHGLTATIKRMDGKDIQKYFGEPLYKKSLPEGIAEGYLKDVDYHIVFDKSIKDKLKDGFDPKTLQDIKDLFKDKPPRDVIAQSIEEEISKLGLVDAKVIVFCEDIDEADEMAELLGGAAYHSGTKDRQQKLDDFRVGRNLRITTRDMFNEGVDIPDAEVSIFLRATGSDTIFEQQLGRVLRKSAGKPKAYVLDFVANIERIVKVRELSDAIQRRARETGKCDVTEEGTIFEGQEQEASVGLHIHTDHSDFDFDKMAVDLLEKWKALQKTSGYSDSVKLSNDEIVALALKIKPSESLTYREVQEMSKQGLFVSGPTLQSRFGSFRDFQAACGFEVKETRKAKFDDSDMTAEELVALAIELKPSEPLVFKEIESLAKDGKFVSGHVIRNRFGSLRAFQIACGFEVKDFAKMSDEELVALALELNPGEQLSVSKIRELSKNKQFVGYAAIIKRFGSLGAFHEACGFEIQDMTKMSDEELVALALSLKPDSPLNFREIASLSKQDSFVGTAFIKKRFGSITAFQKLVVLEQNRPGSNRGKEGS